MFFSRPHWSHLDVGAVLREHGCARDRPSSPARRRGRCRAAAACRPTAAPAASRAARRRRRREIRTCLPVEARDDRAAPDLPAAVPRGDPAHGDRLARLSVSCSSRSAAGRWALDLDRPVHHALRVLHVHEHVDVRVPPVHQRDDASERDRLLVVELGGDRMVRDAGRRSQQPARPAARARRLAVIEDSSSSLLPADLERSAFAAALPRAGNRAVVERQAFDLAVDDVGGSGRSCPWLSASRWTSQPSGLSVAFLIGMLSVPGLIMPLIVFPSQFKMTRMSLLWSLLGPHVPSQDPFRGWPSCAVSGAPGRRRSALTGRSKLASMGSFSRGRLHRRPLRGSQA